MILRSTLIIMAIAIPALGQQPNYQLADWEMTMDQVAPYGPHKAPLPISFKGATVVAAADLNGDEILDLVFGSTGGVEVHYLAWIGHGQWAITGTSEYLTSDTSGCYDLAIGDVTGDNLPDIVVGRRLQNPADVEAGDTDMVYINNGSAPYFDSSNTIKLENPDAGIGMLNLGATFGIELLDGDDDDILDVVSCGNYGIRYHRGNGNLANNYFDYTANLSALYAEEDPCVGGTEIGHHRSITSGDLDADGDTDFIVTRTSGRSSRVFLGTRIVLDTNPLHQWPSYDENAPFVPTDDEGIFDTDRQQCILLPDPDVTIYEEINDLGQIVETILDLGGRHAMGAAFGDLDGDGALPPGLPDLDLVLVNKAGPSAAYLNDGLGFFGSVQGSRDGLPAFEFPVITPTTTFVNGCYQTLAVTLGLLPLPGTGNHYRFTVPGSHLNFCTDTAIADCNGDGLPDVAMSNRSDTLDIPGTEGLPDVYDHLFFNDSSGPGNISFKAIVERLGAANDGTGYGEFFHINPSPTGGSGPTDSRPDWVDANFSNTYPNWLLEPETTCDNVAGYVVGTDEGTGNLVFWGHQAVEHSNRLGQTGGSPPVTTLLVTVDVDVGPEFAGMDCYFMASSTLTSSVVTEFDVGDPATSPIAWDTVTNTSTQPVKSLSATGTATATVRVRMDLLLGVGGPGGTSQPMLNVPALYFAAFVHDGTSFVETTNPVELRSESINW